MSTLNTDRKLPVKAKFGFALLTAAPSIQMLLQMYFLVYFYTNILGLPGGVSGTIILVARIWDFINDPIMGILVEKTGKKPGGKCLYWMKRGIIFAAVFMILCFTAPQFSPALKAVWAAFSFIGLGMSQTAYSIPKDTLYPKLTTNREERAKVNVYAQIINNIINAGVPAITMPLVGILSGFGPNTAFTKLAVMYAIVYLILGFIGIYLCSGFEIDDEFENATGAKKEGPKASEMIKEAASNKVTFAVLLIQVIKMLFAAVTSSVMVYFCTYNLGNVNAMSVSALLSLALNTVPSLLLVQLHKRVGNAGTGAIGALICSLVFGFMFVVHVSDPTTYVVSGLIGSVGAVFIAAVITQCLMDSLDYGEWKTGRKNTAVVMSAYGIGTKIGLAFGGSLAAYIIGAIKFDPTAATQPQHVLDAFFHVSITTQLCVYIVIFFLFLYLLKLEKKLPQMRKEVEERKAAAAAETVTEEV